MNIIIGIDVLEKLKNSMQINKLDDTKKKTLANRTVVSIIILFYYILTLLFSFLSDSTILSLTSTDVIHSLSTRGIMGIIFVVSFFVPLPMAIYEFNKLIFGKNIKSYITLLIVSSLYYLAPNITYIALKNFALIDRFQVTNPLYIKTELYFYISFVVVESVILFIVLNITLIVNKKNNVKNTVTLNGLGFIINFGFLALCYIGLTKSWVLLLFLFFIICSTDVFCYLCGSFFGKRQLAPKISPNKTVEGAIYGAITATAITLAYPGLLLINNTNLLFDKILWINIGYLMDAKNQSLIIQEAPLYLSWILLIILILCLVITCMIGDLLFSYVKRVYEIKDYSNVLKTHGGVLDRLDSILFTATCFTIFFMFIQPLILFWFGINI